MTKKNRDRLLTFAKWLDRCALRVRAYVRRKTPKRAKRSNVVVQLKKGAA